MQLSGVSGSRKEALCFKDLPPTMTYRVELGLGLTSIKNCCSCIALKCTNETYGLVTPTLTFTVLNKTVFILAN